jgi:hypothetical protein
MVAGAALGHTLIYWGASSGVGFLTWFRLDFPNILHQDLKIVTGIAILTGILALTLRAAGSAD